MNSYDNYGDNRFQSLLAAHKPRAWKQERPLDMTVYSKPEPTSKTRIPSKTTFIVANADAVLSPQQY